jgi:hypothetical protein
MERSVWMIEKSMDQAEHPVVAEWPAGPVAGSPHL